MKDKRRHPHPILSEGLRISDAAKYLGVSESTLNHLRSAGSGPLYTKYGRCIFYDPVDLDAWIKTRVKKFRSTADYEAAR